MHISKWCQVMVIPRYYYIVNYSQIQLKCRYKGKELINDRSDIDEGGRQVKVFETLSNDDPTILWLEH